MSVYKSPGSTTAKELITIVLLELMLLVYLFLEQ